MLPCSPPKTHCPTHHTRPQPPHQPHPPTQPPQHPPSTTPLYRRGNTSSPHKLTTPGPTTPSLCSPLCPLSTPNPPHCKSGTPPMADHRTTHRSPPNATPKRARCRRAPEHTLAPLLGAAQPRCQPNTGPPTPPPNTHTHTQTHTHTHTHTHTNTHTHTHTSRSDDNRHTDQPHATSKQPPLLPAPVVA
jgi:hypothetical protein